MAVLLPSILTGHAEDAVEKLRFLESVPELADVQIDFADGEFVPNKTIEPKDLPKLESRLRLEAHLMVRSPQNYIHDLEHRGFAAVAVHYESFARHHDVITCARNLKALGFSAGVAINPQTEVSVFHGLMGEIDFAVIMGVNPGYQGQEFIPETLERIHELRKQFPDAVIEVDGGVRLDNFESMVAHGASRINVGSAIWQTRDPKQTIYEFLKFTK